MIYIIKLLTKGNNYYCKNNNNTANKIKNLNDQRKKI